MRKAVEKGKTPRLEDAGLPESIESGKKVAERKRVSDLTGVFDIMPFVESSTPLAEFTQNLARVNKGSVTVGYYGSRVHRLLLGLQSPSDADLDLSYGLCDMDGNDVRPFTAAKARASALHAKISLHKPGSYNGARPFVLPFITYFNAVGNVYKPGVRSETEFTPFPFAYTMERVMLATDGVKGRLVCAAGSLEDLMERRLRLAEGVISGEVKREGAVGIALRGIRYKLEYGMQFEDRTREWIKAQNSVKDFSRDMLLDKRNIELAAKVVNLSADSNRITEALKEFNMDKFIKQALLYDDNSKPYQKLKEGLKKHKMQT